MPEPVLRIRRFRPADIAAVSAIENSSFRRWAWPRELLLDYAAEMPELFLVAEAAGRIVAYAITGVRGDRAELVSIAVRPGCRRTGAGQELLAAILRRLARRPVTRIGLAVKVTNHAALRFYLKHGFRRLRRQPKYYEDGSDAILMTRAV